MKKAQKTQDEQYNFPYHYIPEYRKYFKSVKYWQWGINYVATLELIIDKLKSEKFQRIVDIGSGDGRLVYELTKQYPKREVIGIDYSEKAINLAKAMFPQGDYRRLDIAKESLRSDANVVTLIEVLEHIPLKNVKKFINGVYGLLSNDGKLLITVPHTNVPVQTKHFQHFNSAKIKNLFAKDFKIESINYLGKQGFMYQMVLKTLENEYFILNNKTLLDLIYRYYKNNIFFSNERECSRIYIELRKR